MSRRVVDVFAAAWRRVGILGLCAWSLCVGCGPDDPGGGDTARGASDASDGAVVDGGNPNTGSCDYQGNSEGVCADQPTVSNGTCMKPSAYESSESSCGDGVDNDCDGKVDCADPDCTGASCGLGQGTAECVSGSCQELVCHDEVDNDEDNKIDCEDPDCTGETCKRGTEYTCPSPEDWEDNESKCDGIDNDCDGATDEGCDCVYDPSEDAKVDTDDSHNSGVCTGQSRNQQGQCARPALHEPRTGAESGCDGKDNDCDGNVDEGCPCAFNPNKDDNVDTGGEYDNGVCANQRQDSSGVCIEPSGFEPRTDQETCDGDDNDCDGTVDEGCGCTYDPNESDNTDTDGSHNSGVCANQGTDASGACQKPSAFEARTAAESKCDGKDNDCDGAFDEGCSCTYDPGESGKSDTDGSHSTGVCVGQSRDSSGICTAPGNFESRTSNESCDGVDNDCDGTVDEGCGCTYDPNETDNIDTDGSHASGVCPGQGTDANGACKKPSNFEMRTASESSCDSTDNDCDGNVDEGCGCVYDPNEMNNIDTDGTHQSGVCTGQNRDAMGVCNTPSTFENRTGTESTCSGKDNDCDGVTDEGCPCVYDPNEPMNVDTDGSNDAGVCQTALRDASATCQKPSGYDATDDEQSAGLCDGKDNDCDGAVDEYCSCIYDPTETDKVDTDGSHDTGSVCPGQSRDANGVCKTPANFEGTQSDAESGSSCKDGKDNDCDGYTDEGCPCNYKNKNEGVCTGQTLDKSGNCQKPSNYNDPEDGGNDNLDNDCDGITDEGTKRAGDSCGSDSECDSGHCVGGTCAHRIFVTSSGSSGNLGGLSGATSMCNSVASSAGLVGTWKAVLSTSSTDAKSYVTINSAVYEVEDDKIADGKSDLWDGSIDNSLTRDENGSLNTSADPWTGTDPNGTVASSGDTCNGWTDGSSGPDGQLGESTSSGSKWLDAGSQGCNLGRSIICIDGQ